jgi:hypothetical protein
VSAAVEVVLQRLGIEAKRIGSRWWGERCPMPEHTNQNEAHRFKNMFVRADGHRAAGLWHCYSCQAGGKLVELVMKVRGCEFREALDWLRDVEEAPAPSPVVRVRYEEIGVTRRFEMPGGVEFAPLAAWNSVPRAYVVGRGLTAQQVERWGVGYALMGKLDGRIVFPIVDAGGRLANYAARTFVGDEVRVKAADERWEHPDTSAMLGEVHWPKSAVERARATCVVFEGAFSGLAIERALRGRAGLYLAGLQGSDVANPRRALKLSAFGRVVSAADPDRAGDRVSDDLAAALRRVPFVRFRYPGKVDAADTPEDELAAALAEQLGAAS